MSKLFRSSRFIYVVAALLLASTAAWADSVAEVTSQSALSPNDSILWAQLGGDQTQLAATFGVTSKSGLGATVTLTGANSVVSVVCGQKTGNCSWTNTGFPAGDTVLWTVNPSTGGNGPVTLALNKGGIAGVGALIQPDAPGQFTASIQAFNGSTSLGTFTEQSDAAGDPIYLGVLDSTGMNITSVVYSLTACASNCADFALDSVDLATSVVAPPPNFSLSASPNSVSVAQESSSASASTVTITPSNGFNGSVTLSALNLPNGVTATFTPNPATTSSSLTLSAAATATTGGAAVTIQGVSGILTNTTPLSLTVTVPQVTVSPASLDFGILYIGQNKTSLLTLTNKTTASVPIGPISFNVTSGDPAQFTFTQTCTATLAAKRTCGVRVSFRPDQAGSDTATLNIVAGTSTIQVPITASGLNRVTSGGVYFTNTLSGSGLTQLGVYQPVMTLTLPAGSYLITGNVEMTVPTYVFSGYLQFGEAATCALMDSVGTINLPGQTAISQWVPPPGGTGPGTVISPPLVASLQAVAYYPAPVTVTISCAEVGQNLVSLVLGSGTLSALPVTSITKQ